jgi:hypothetical protein
MSKTVVAVVGGEPRQFTGVKKLETKDPGGDTCTWVPEDEIEEYASGHLIEKTITENGVYDPAKEYYDEDKKIMADGYSRVTVNVAGGGGKETREITAVALQDLKAREDAACRMQISNYASIKGASVLYAYGSHIYAWRLTSDYRSWIDQYDMGTGGLKKTVADGDRGSKDTETGNPATNAIFDGKYILICGIKSWSVIDAETGDLIVDQQAWGDITLHGNSYYGTDNLKTANHVLPKQYDRIIAGTGNIDNFLVFDITVKSITPLALKGYTKPFPYTDDSFVALSYSDNYYIPGYFKPTGIAIFDFTGNIIKHFSLPDAMVAKDGLRRVSNTYYCYNQRLYWRGRAGTDYNKSILIWDLENLSDGATLDGTNATIVDVGIDLNVTAIDSSNDDNSAGGNAFYLSQDKKKLISSCKNGTYCIDIDTNTAHTISTTNIAGAKIGFIDAFLCNGSLYDYDGKTLPNIKRYVARAAQSYNQHPESWMLGFMKEDAAMGALGKVSVIFDNLRQIYDFDFTKSLTDTISGVKAALCNGATQDGEGIHIAHAKEYAELFRIPAFPCFFEVEFGDFNAISNGSDGTVFYSAGGLWHIPSLRTGKTGWWEYCDGWYGPLNVGESADVFQNASLLVAISESKELDIYVKIQDTYKLALHRQSMTAGVCDSLIQIGRNDVYGAYGMTLKSCKVWQGEFEDYNLMEKIV